MNQPSCDRCHCEIDPITDVRYSLTIEIEAVVDGDERELADDPEHLDELQDLLESADEYCSSAFDDELYQLKQFDLCKKCFRAYIKNPLSLDGKRSSFAG